MAELNKWQNILFRAGAILLLAGLGMRLFLHPAACWVTALGAVLFAAMQMLMRYDGPSVNLQRLRRQQVFSDFVFLVTAALMVMQDNDWGSVWAHGNAWILCLVIACVLQVYTAFRIPQELEREKGRRGA